MKRSYYSMTKTGNTATINIYGDITSYPYFEGDVSSSNLSKQLEQMKDVSEINVYISSYGGEVAEGLAIYNALKRHKAKVKTFCDGFAASIASVIFMAGDERVMNDSSLLMIHNAWTCVEGNAEQLRKQADALEKITQASVVAYKAHSTLSEKEIVALMDAETWILPEEALSYGFATAIEKTEKANASQNARQSLLNIIKAAQDSSGRAKSEENSEDEEDIDENENAKERDIEPESDTPETEDDTEETEEAEVETPEDEEKPEDDSEEETEESDGDDEEERAAQKMERFFNALLKL